MSDFHQIVENAQELLTLNQTGILSTISSAVQDYPFGSITPYDIDEFGRLIIFVANISEHYRNLSKNPRSCLFVPDYFGFYDPQAHARVGVLGDFIQVTDTAEEKNVSASYWKRFPDSVSREIAHSFVYFRCTPQRLRWIGGFGEIRWIESKQYEPFQRDHVAYAGWDIIQHMNDDHPDALADLLKFHSSSSVPREVVTMVAVNRKSFTVAFGRGSKRERAVIPFSRAAENPSDVRAILIEMLKLARGS